MAFYYFLFASLFSVIVSEGVDYSDLQSLGSACYPRDTCNRPRGITFPNASCECDNLCISYSDCCFDAPAVLRHSAAERRAGLSCLPYEKHKGVYAVDKCSQSWTGHRTVKDRCENNDDFSDPLLSMPVTDTQAHITYRSAYCAECNNANLNNLSIWSPTLICDSLKPVNSEYKNITHDFIVQNIARVNNHWGVYHWNQSSRGTSFFPCDVSFSLPVDLSERVRGCAPDVVSTCASNWRRDQVRRYCRSYMAVVFVDGQAYRNVHCALCSLGTLFSVQCLPPAITQRERPPLSFTLLVDVNPRDGNLVGMTNSCPASQKYDPFFKKCRTLVCAIPGFVLRNGRCVRQ